MSLIEGLAKRHAPYLPVTASLRDFLLQSATDCDKVRQSATQNSPESSAYTVLSEDTNIHTDLVHNNAGADVDDRIDSATAVAAVIAESNWRNMRLPKGHTPQSYAEKLVEAFPDTCTPGAIREAALWVENTPKKSANKKYLGGFLTNWCRNQRRFNGQSSFSDHRRAVRRTDAARASATASDWMEGADNA